MPDPIDIAAHRIESRQLPAIAIGILSFNRSAQALRTLAILDAIDYPRESVHITVIDNASTDGTAEAITGAWGDRVEVLTLPENMGAVARNRVMMERPEPYIFSFDEDCAPEHPGTIREAVEFMERNRSFGALCFQSINLYSRTLEFAEMGRGAHRALPDGVLEGIFVVGAGMCFRREAVQGTRGYDERLFWGGEEHGLSMELLARGLPVALSPRFRLIHRHAGRAFPALRAVEMNTRNNIWTAFRYAPIPIATLVTLIQTGRRLAAGLVRGKPDVTSAVLRGAAEGLRGLPDLLADRTPIPMSRIASYNRWFFQMLFPRSSRRPAEQVEIREEHFLP